MIRHAKVIAAALAATLVAGCKPPGEGVDAHAPLHGALSAAGRAQACAAELTQAVDDDARGTAAALQVEPVALAPWGGAERGKAELRALIRARAAAARDAARAARSLSLLGEYASAQQEALLRERIAASLATSSALCGAAAEVRGGLLAQRRETNEPP
jgi:hypothetical protein